MGIKVKAFGLSKKVMKSIELLMEKFYVNYYVLVVEIECI